MTHTGRRPPESAELAGVGGLLRTAGSGDASAQHLLEGRRRLVLAVEKLGEPSRAWRPLMAASFAAAMLVVAWFTLGHLRSAPPLTYVIAGGGASNHGDVSAVEGGEGATLRFSDGSEVALAAGSRGRVASTTAEGGDVVLETGRATARVVHRAHTRWTFAAGPYAVRVIGTAFTVNWASDQGVFDLWLREGGVVVSGPAAPQGVTLAAGQHLRADTSTGSLLIDSAPQPPTSTAAPGPADVSPKLSGAAPGALPPAGAAPTQPPTDATPPLGTTSPGDAPRPGTTPPDLAPPNSLPSAGATLPGAPKHASSADVASPKLGWPKLVAAGDYDAVLEAARQQGEGDALSTRPVGDLRALADAARYRGDVGLAGRSYGALRKRFASSPEARTAAFLLGRLAEEQQHTPAAALRWYDTYLSEAPRGPLAGDALGRKMVLTSRVEGASAARELAREYLRRYPGGGYASAARALAK